MFNPPKLIGHRGVKNISPENTLDSIESAYKSGLDWVEIDVKISRDFVPILLHDDTLDRTTNGKGIPLNYNYSDLKKFDAGYFFYSYPTQIYIPTLREVIAFCKERNIGINIEIKSNLGFEKQNVEAVIKVINIMNYKKIYFSSFDWSSIIMIKEKLPNIECGLIVDDFNSKITIDQVIEVCNQYQLSSCGFNKKIINSEIINKMKNNNLIITVFDEESLKLKEVENLYSSGVKSFFIDDPSDFMMV